MVSLEGFTDNEFHISTHPGSEPNFLHDDSTSNVISVVIDTVMFSSSVITLLDIGVENVIAVKETNDLISYSDDMLIGGDTRELSDGETVDFSNSPQSIYGAIGVLDSTPETVALSSNNGAVACERLRELSQKYQYDNTIILGSTLNVSAVTTFLQDQLEQSDNPLKIVFYCAGHNNIPTFEDTITAVLLYNKLFDTGVTANYGDIIRMYLETFRYSDEAWWLEENVSHMAQVDSSDCLPISTNKSNVNFSEHTW